MSGTEADDPTSVATGGWALRRFLAAGDLAAVPDYGTPEWLDLADSDPRKVAAVVFAAERWRWRSPEMLAALAEMRGLTADPARRALGEAIATLAASWDWWRPPHADVVRGREQTLADALARGDGTYPGRAGGAHGVDWATGAWLDRSGAPLAPDLLPVAA